MIHIQRYKDSLPSKVLGYRNMKSPSVITLANKLYYTRIGKPKTPLEIYIDENNNYDINVANLAIIDCSTSLIGVCRIGKK